jgi:hypothetical protein
MLGLHTETQNLFKWKAIGSAGRPLTGDYDYD